MQVTLRRIGAVVVVGVIAALALAAPATAVPGVTREVGDPTDDNIVAVKTAEATCPASTPRIVGVGARVENDETGRVFLRRLQPIKNVGGQDKASVTSAAPTGVVTSYRLLAVAVCAPSASVPGHQVVRSLFTGPSSATTQDTAAVCPAGKKVIGYGAEVNGDRGVGLQVVRSDKLRGISRAYARELPPGYADQWGVQAVAICFTTNGTETPVGAAIPGSDATVLCPTSPVTLVHGAGGGAWDGTGMIRRLEPSSDLGRARVELTPGSTATLVSLLCLR
jgi:hypothetical protein